MSRTTKIDYRAAAMAAAHGNSFPLQQALESLEARTAAVEKKVGNQGYDSQQQSPSAPTPPYASVSTSAVPKSGRFVVRITNPEYVARGNKPKTPLLHLVEFSPKPDFSSGVITFPVSTQTYYSVPIEDVGGVPGSPWTGVFRWRSSYDGENFNQPVVSPLLTA